MLNTEITIERSPEIVWAYFTEPKNWEKWWCGGLKAAQWHEGGKLEWALGGSAPIETIIPSRMVQIAGSWLSTTFTFEPKGSGKTLVRIQESEPKGGASFSDGGTSHLAQVNSSLDKLKEHIESETKQDREGNISTSGYSYPHCGYELQVDARFGNKQVKEKTMATEIQYPAPPPLPSMSAEPRYKGVGGWLLLLCLGFTVFSPLITLGSLAVGYNDSSKYFDLFPGLLIILVIDTFLSLGLMAFSVYAGIGLWRIRPGAVQMAKRYLLCFLGYLAVASVLPFMAGLPSAANEAMITEVVKNAFRGIVYFAVWYSYLNKSKRVRATYPT